MFSTLRRSSSNAAGLRCLLAFAALAQTAGAAGALPVIGIGNGKQSAAAIFIGDNLTAGLEGGEAAETYEFRLRDGAGTVIAGFTAETDAAGRIPPRLFWPRTGVRGCDLGVSIDPTLYQFQQFADAEDALAGQILVLEVLREDDTLAAARAVPILATLQEVAYFSNAAGCLRQHFRDDEHVYVSLRHPDRNAATRRIYLVPSGPLPLGSGFTDVRGLATPPIWTLPATGNPVTYKVWDASQSVLGSYSGLFRWTGSSACRVNAFDLLDEYPHLPFPPDPGGILITVDGCTGCYKP